MKKKIFVEESKFNKAISALLKTRPVMRGKIKVRGKRSPKPVLSPKS